MGFSGTLNNGMGIVWDPLTIRGSHYWGSLESPLIKETSLGCIHVLLIYIFLDQDQRVHYFDIEIIILLYDIL